MKAIKGMFTVAVLLAAMSGLADTETVNGYTWTYQINGDTAEIYNYYSAAISPKPTGAVTIPSALGGKPVTCIGSYAFSGCSGLTSVSIPNSVTDIGIETFADCSGLTSVTIPNSVTSIGDSAFSGCSGLTSVTIPNSVMYIGWLAFSVCNGLTSVTIGDGVTIIGLQAFYNCSRLTNITVIAANTVYKSVDGLLLSKDGRNLIQGVNGKVTIPDGVTSIGDCAFSGCSGLTSVTIPNSVTNIGWSAFSGCSGLTSVTISDGVTSFGDYAFRGCSGLTSVTLPNSVTNIGSYAFSSCSGLTSVTIPSGVTIIGAYAFSDCNGLMSVTIPDSVTSIGGGAFSNCSRLTSFEISEGNQSYKSESSLLLTKDGKTLVMVLMGLTSVTIPDSVTNIGRSAFSGCSRLTSVTIPNTVTSIGGDSFSGCSGLASMTIPNSVTNIGWSAFYGCRGLTSVSIPNSVTNIGSGAFSGCSGLTSVTIPQYVCTNSLSYVFSGAYQSITNVIICEGVTSIGDSTFSYCSGLTSVTIPNSVTSIGDYAFRGCSGLASMTIPNSVTNIGRNAFSYCSGLTSVTIPDGVTRIREEAFCGCRGLESVTIPDSVTSIGSGAFSGCSDSLYDTTTMLGVRLVDGWAVGYTSSISNCLDLSDVRGIGSDAFYDCSWLTNVVIGSGVTSIGSSAFRGCSGLTSVTIPDSVTSIGDYAFLGCSGLTNVTIGSGVTSLELYTFVELDKLERVTIGNGVTNIEHYAFYGCTNLKDVIIPDSVISIGAGEFDATPFYRNQPDGLVMFGRVAYKMKGQCPAAVVIPDGTVSICGDAFYNCSGLTSVTIPDSVTSIGNYAFEYCSGLVGELTVPESVTSVGAYAFYGCNRLTCVYLPKGCSVGTSVFPSGTKLIRYKSNQTATFDANGGICETESISVTLGSAYGDLPVPSRVGHSFSGWTFDGEPVTSNTVVSAFDDHLLVAQWAKNRYTVMFDANGGVCETESTNVEYGVEIGALPVPTRTKAIFGGWFTETEGGDEVDESFTVLKATTLYAHWLTKAANPVIATTEGSTEFRRDCVVSITCAMEGAAIYYTDDGSTPRMNDDYLYTEPIAIAETTTFKAIAVVGDVLSDYVTVTITKNPLTLEEVLDVGEGVAVATSAPIPWTPVFDSTAKVGDATVRSGAIGNRTNTWLSATVSGAGAMTFWCKTSCEHDADNTFTWDRLMVYTNGVEITEWRMDGETDWTRRALSFAGGENTVMWVYYKDKSGAEGEDCAWVDGVAWISSHEVSITFDANGGNLGDADALRVYMIGDVVGELPQPMREGYGFDGWMHLDEVVTSDMLVSTPTNCSFVARWTANSYSISYNPNGGSGTTSATAATYDSEATVAANGFTRKGFRFVGWATSANGEVVYAEGQRVMNLTAQSGGIVTLYAVWAEEDAYIESDGSAGAGINTGFFFGPQSKVEIDFQMTTNDANQARLFGASGTQNDDSKPECECYIGEPSAGQRMFSFICGKSGGARQSSNFKALDMQRHRIVMDFYAEKEFQVWTGNSKSAKALGDFPANRQRYPLSFFCKNNTTLGTYSTRSTTLYSPTPMRVYRFRIWDAGVLVRDYVPCVKGGIPGFKENCSGRFVTGENIAAFTAGGNVTEEEDDPYISSPSNKPGVAESGKTVYLDTGYTVKPNSRVELDYALLANWATNNLYGSSGGNILTCSGKNSAGEQFYLLALGPSTSAGFYYWKVGPDGSEGSVSQIGIAAANGVRRTVSMGGNSLYVVTEGYTNFAKAVTSGISAAFSNSLKVGLYLPMKIYGLKIYESDVLVKDYRPFVTNGVPGLIDALHPTASLFATTYGGGGRTNVVFDVGGDLQDYTMPRERDLYLEFDGEAGHSIDTGYVVKPTSCIEADFSVYNTTYNDQQEFFKQDVSGANILARIYMNSAYTLSYQFEDYSTYRTGVGINTGVSAADNRRRQFKFDGGNNRVLIKCGDEVLYDQAMARAHVNTGSGTTMIIGAKRACMRLYGFKISEAGRYVRNYVPYLKDGQAGLYDLCTNAFTPLEGGEVDNATRTSNGTADIAVDIGVGSDVPVPVPWLAEHSVFLDVANGDVEAALNATAANGRMSVAECYVVGLDPEISTNDFTITSFPMKADGTPDLDAILSSIDPPQSNWNVSGARPVLKGAASLDADFVPVTDQNKSSFRFFRVEVELP